jgi:endonuclease/exonuclease/phosphatase family metal-dependent hydrolase
MSTSSTVRVRLAQRLTGGLAVVRGLSRAVAAPSLVDRAGVGSGLAMASDVTTTGAAVTTETPVRMAQANLWAGMGTSVFATDVATIVADRPDFITYNEVDGRQDTALAPAPYQVFRAARTGTADVDKYTRETAVAWDASKWTPLASGTWNISNVRGKYDWQNREWGIRYANWVTLTNADGRIVSVVSVHVAPDTTEFTAGILDPSLRSIGRLADQLDDQGPVMIGGDLNVNYRETAKYPRSLMAELDLTPTYDVLKASLPTGDQKGATIDYVLLRSSANFSVKQQYTRELNSDHDLLVADAAVLSDRIGSWGAGIVVSDPVVAPMKVVYTVARAIDGMPAGSTLHLAARTMYRSPVLAAVRRAKTRGVQVQIIFGDRTPTPAINAMIRLLGTNTARKSWAVNRPRPYTRFGLPPLQVLASESGGTPALRIDVNRPIQNTPYTQTMVGRIYTDGVSYDTAFRTFFAAAGRPL